MTKEKYRHTVDLPLRLEEVLKKTKEISNASTGTEVFQKALQLYHDAQKAVQEGYVIRAVSDDPEKHDKEFWLL